MIKIGEYYGSIESAVDSSELCHGMASRHWEVGALPPFRLGLIVNLRLRLRGPEMVLSLPTL